jgi:hypothetical protein
VASGVQEVCNAEPRDEIAHLPDKQVLTSDGLTNVNDTNLPLKEMT